MSDRYTSQKNCGLFAYQKLKDISQMIYFLVGGDLESFGSFILIIGLYQVVN